MTSNSKILSLPFGAVLVVVEMWAEFPMSVPLIAFPGGDLFLLDYVCVQAHWYATPSDRQWMIEYLCVPYSLYVQEAAPWNSKNTKT